MRTTLVRPRVVIDRAVAIRPANARPEYAYGLLSLLTGASWAGSLFLDGVVHRVALAMTGVVMLVAILWLRALAGAAARGAVRVPQEGGLRFIPPRRLIVTQLLLPLVGVVPGILGLLAPGLTGEQMLASRGSVWLMLMSGASALWLAKQLVDLRVLTGLGVGESGLVGVRGGAEVRLPWERLESASVVTSSTGARLAITAVEGSVVTIQAPQIGSDPNVVAAIIEHFRTHPEDREALGNAREAIRRVEAAHA